LIIHSSFHGGDGGGDVAAAVIIFSIPLYGDFLQHSQKG